MDPWPADNTNLSRLNHFALAELWFIKSVHRVYAIGAAPIGNPGWPEFAFSIASMTIVRIVLMESRSICVVMFDLLSDVWFVQGSTRILLSRLSLFLQFLDFFWGDIMTFWIDDRHCFKLIFK